MDPMAIVIPKQQTGKLEFSMGKLWKITVFNW